MLGVQSQVVVRSTSRWGCPPRRCVMSPEIRVLQEIRVRFQSCGDSRFRVQLTDSAGKGCGVAGDFAPFLTDEDYENLRWYLEEYMDLPDGGAVVRAGGI